MTGAATEPGTARADGRGRRTSRGGRSSHQCPQSDSPPCPPLHRGARGDLAPSAPGKRPLSSLRIFPLFALLLVLLCSGCATRKGVFVLLPEDGRPSGEVTVSSAGETRVLNQSWQSVEIDGKKGTPGRPVLRSESQVTGEFGKVMAAMPAAPVHFLLYFKLDSTDLLPESQLLLPEIVKRVGERQPATVSVVGHTDTTGSETYNYQLGLRRASAVLDRLGALGMKAVGVEVLSRGKAEPQVNTPDQVLEPRNRRADVTVR